MTWHNKYVSLTCFLSWQNCSNSVVIPKPAHEQVAEPGETQVWNRKLRQGCRSKRLQGKAIILQPGWTFLLLPAAPQHRCDEGMSYWGWSCGYNLYHSSANAWYWLSSSHLVVCLVCNWCGFVYCSAIWSGKGDDKYMDLFNFFIYIYGNLKRRLSKASSLPPNIVNNSIK